jgi:hypothetical protein
MNLNRALQALTRRLYGSLYHIDFDDRGIEKVARTIARDHGVPIASLLAALPPKPMTLRSAKVDNLAKRLRRS